MAEKISSKLGLPPGTPVYVGEEPFGGFVAKGLGMTSDGITAAHFATPQELLDYPATKQCSLLIMQGLQDTASIVAVGEGLGLHPLVIEDILNSEQSPKIQFEKGYIYIALRFFHRREDGVIGENISLVLGSNYVAIFLEEEHKEFEVMGNRFQMKNNKIKEMGASYLAFALLDYWVDHYFLLLEWLEDEVWEMEDQLFNDEVEPSILEDMHGLRKDAMNLRRYARPCLEIAHQLLHSDHDLIDDHTGPFYRDLHEHVTQVLDMAEANLELLLNLQAQFLAISAQKTNEVMKFLTIVGAIFIPLTFLVGVYGMNFEVMPELKWRWGYFVLWGLMLGISGGMLAYFRRRKWI